MLSSKYASLLFDQIPDRRVVGTDRNTHLLTCCNKNNLILTFEFGNILVTYQNEFPSGDNTPIGSFKQ